jgi:hypothetical protein
VESIRPRGRPRNRWQDEARKSGGRVWKGRLYKREEWKRLLRTARNCHIVHMAMEWMNGRMNEYIISSTVELPTTFQTLNNISKGKGNPIPSQPLTGPEGSSRFRLPDFKTIGT